MTSKNRGALSNPQGRFEVHNLNIILSESLDTDSFQRPVKSKPDSWQMDLWA